MSRNLIRTFLLLSGVLWLSACVPSLQPLFTDKDRTTDSDLLGTWTQVDSKDAWEFESGPDESYLLTYTENGVSARFNANLVQLQDHLFLDLYPAEEAGLKNDLLRLHLVPTHTFARLAINGDSLELAMMDNDWLRAKLARKELILPHQLLEDGVLLTASTKELQAFMTKFAVDSAAFPKLTVLKRAE